MKLKFKNSFIGYFQFYYSVLGNKLLFNTALGVVVSFLDGIGLAMFMPLLQAVSNGDSSDSGSSMGKLSFLVKMIKGMGFGLTLNTVLVVLVILFSVKGILKFFQLNAQVNLTHFFMRKIRFELLAKLRELSYRGFLDLDNGKIQNTLTSEVWRLNQTVKFYSLAVQSGVMLLTYVALAFLANYQFAILVAIGAGISNLAYRKIYQSTKAASFNVSKKGSEFNRLIVQAVHYFKYLKSTNYFTSFSKHIKKVIRESEESNKRMGFNAAITTSLKEPMIMVIVALVIYLQVNMMGANLAAIILSLLLFYRGLSALVLVQNYWQSFIQNIGSMESVSTLYNDMLSSTEEQNDTKFNAFDKQLQIKEVTFTYNGVTPILDNIDIVIPKNRTIALIGESGSGKTTLANMIAGLIKPEVGSMYIDNVALGDYNVDSFRDKIGYISQEAVIFNDTIFNNITFWAEPTPENMERFWHSIAMVSLTDFVNNQPEKEHTKLGDHGMLISGGQKQRISIARELYKTVDILILDEATSALDSETERIIQDNIEKLHGTYTMIIIAHRLSTIKDADIIYLLNKGQVESSGTFDELMVRSERFKHMVSLQEMSVQNADNQIKITE